MEDRGKKSEARNKRMEDGRLMIENGNWRGWHDFCI